MKKLHVEYWDGNEISRYMMHQPISKDFEFKGLFTTRNYPQYPRPRFYIYTQNEETLVMTADYDKGTNPSFIISINANEITKKSKFYLGVLEQYKAGKKFVSYSWHLYKDETKREMIRIMKNKKTSSLSYRVFIPVLGFQTLLQPKEKIPKIPENSIELEVTARSEANISFESYYQEKLCFEFRQIEEDEYAFQAGYPLTIYQAFSIGLIICKSLIK